MEKRRPALGIFLERSSLIFPILPPKIHTIAMDLDGTLLDSRGRISSLNSYVLNSALEKGMRLVIATGRRFSSTLPFAREFKGDLFVISNNGQVMRESPSGARVSETYLSSDAIAAVLDSGKREGFDPILHVDHYEEGIDILAESPITDPRFYNYSGGDTERSRVVEDCFLHGSDRVLVACFLSQEKTRLEELERKLLCLPEASGFRTVLTRIHGVSFCLEILEKNSSKWSAISSFLKANGLDPGGVAAFGDEKNDLEMLSHAGFGFAMKNAVPYLKKFAPYNTRYSNDEDGIAMTLLELGILSFP
nr:HAD family hydrolase [Leptospira fluminis]